MPAATIALPSAAWESPRTMTSRRRPSPGSALRPARRPLLRLTEPASSSFVSEGSSSHAADMTKTSFAEAPVQQPSSLGLSGVYPKTQASIISVFSPPVSSSPTRPTTPLVAAPPALCSRITERQLPPSPAVVAPMPPTSHHHGTRRPSLTFSFVSTSTAYAELPPTPLDAPATSGGFPFPTTASPSFSSSASHNAGVAEFWADAMEGCGDEPASTVPTVGALGLDGTTVPFPLCPLSTVSLGRKKPRREDDNHPNITTPPLAPRLAHIQPLPPPPSPIVGVGLAPLTPLEPSPASLSRGRERSRERSCERSCSIERGRERGRVR